MDVEEQPDHLSDGSAPFRSPFLFAKCDSLDSVSIPNQIRTQFGPLQQCDSREREGDVGAVFGSRSANLVAIDAAVSSVLSWLSDSITQSHLSHAAV